MIGGEQEWAEATATRLLLTFGSIDSVLSAHPDSLRRFIDDADLVDRIAIAKSVVMEGLGEQVRRPCSIGWSACSKGYGSNPSTSPFSTTRNA